MMKDAVVVARRCLCLELLLQRFALETDDDEPTSERDASREKWIVRLTDLGIDDELSTEERALLERPVGELSDDDLDDLYGRASAAAVLLWALGRVTARPSFASMNGIEGVIEEHGLLGAGSVSAAKAAVESAELRPEPELTGAQRAYERTRGKARETSDPEKIGAELAAHHLAWVLDPEMSLEED